MRQQRLQKTDDRANGDDVSVKVGPGVAEQHADIVLGHDDCIGVNTLVRVLERNDERRLPAVAMHPADDVCTRTAVEHCFQHFDKAERRGLSARAPIGIEFSRQIADGAFGVAVRCIEAVVREHFVEHKLERAAYRIFAPAHLIRCVLRWSDVLGNELDGRVDADGAKNSPCNRAEKGLVKLAIDTCSDRSRKALLDVGPDFTLLAKFAEFVANLCRGGTYRATVEFDALDGIGLHAVPVTLFEAQLRALGYASEIRVVAFEARHQRGGGNAGGFTVCCCHHRRWAPRVARSWRSQTPST